MIYVSILRNYIRIFKYVVIPLLMIKHNFKYNDQMTEVDPLITEKCMMPLNMMRCYMTKPTIRSAVSELSQC